MTSHHRKGHQKETWSAMVSFTSSSLHVLPSLGCRGCFEGGCVCDGCTEGADRGLGGLNHGDKGSLGLGYFHRFVVCGGVDSTSAFGAHATRRDDTAGDEPFTEAEVHRAMTLGAHVARTAARMRYGMLDDAV